MLKAILSTETEDWLLLGLTEENLRRLPGEPIVIDLQEIERMKTSNKENPLVKILIVTGKNNDAIVADLEGKSENMAQSIAKARQEGRVHNL